MRTSKSRVTGVVALTSAIALTLSACGGGDTGSTDNSGGAGDEGGTSTITAAVAYETSNYHPSNTSSALALGSNWHVVEGLYDLNMHDFTPYKALAADDDLTEVSETEYEVTLRDGAKFSDGSDVTSEDVVKSFERTMDPDGLYISMLSFIDSVEAKDESTVTINLKHPFSLTKERLSLVKIVPADASDDELTSKPIGTGPWKYDSISEQELVFSPNEHYNGDHPAEADEMKWQIIMDDTARTTAMQEGTVQVMENVPADAIEQIKSSGAEAETVQGFNLPFLMFNTKKAPFDDEKVRQAFFYAIDTEKLIQNALSGEATPAKSFLPEDHPNFHEAKNVFTYDPDKAKELLDEAGVSDLSLTLLTTDHGWIEALSPQIKNDLEAIGLSVDIHSEASSSLYANNTDVESPDFDVVLAPGDPSVFGNDPDLLMNWWYGDNTWTNSRTQWADSAGFTQLQGILLEAVQLTDAEQQDKWNEAFDLISEQVPLYPLFHRTLTTAYSGDLDGFQPISTTGLNFIDTKLK
ncbi:MAG: ABC transporter substrate-binding protein [Flaviflexus sp.]|nr:ABC transporter substrate-binding protein [Flaviflexus sp.]